MRVARGVVASVLSCLLAGCSSSPAPGPSPTAGPVALGHSYAAPVPVLTASESQGLLTLPWRLWRISHHARRVLIWYAAGGGCVSPVGVQVVENADQVVIAPKSRSTASPGTVCTTELLVGRGYVDLQTPLNGRRLVHARVSSGWRGVL